MVEAEVRGDRSGERVFTTLLWPGAKPLLWPWHLERLDRDARQMGLAAAAVGHIEAAVVDALRSRRGDVARVRIDLVADGGSALDEPPARTLVRVAVSEPPAAGLPAQGLTLARVPTACGEGHPLAGTKRPDAVRGWARRRATAAGFDDALLVCARGDLVETTTAALLLGLDDGSVVVPGQGCGAVRSTTLAWLATRRSIAARRVAFAECTTVRWALACNAVRGAVPVARLGDRRLQRPDGDWQQVIDAAVRATAPAGA
ncbi:MAG: aminotransferase class IV [Deltaproteobacteria bacterium]|nr:aminotransferase class IV [Deltaproteobacteria bacterium]